MSDAITMVTVTLTAVTVSPALVDPTPLVSTDRGISLAENFRNCDLAVPIVCNNDPQYVTVTIQAMEVTQYLDHLLIVNGIHLSHDYHLIPPFSTLTTCYHSYTLTTPT